MINMKEISKMMMKYGAIYLILITAFTACSEDEEVANSNESIDVEQVQNEEAMSSAFEDLGDLGTVVYEEQVEQDLAGGRFGRDGRFECAEITKDTANKTVTIDFGEEGCEGPGGRIRKGKIILEYTDRKFIPGAQLVITPEGFSINDIVLTGTKTITNISVDLEDNPTFHIVLENGLATWPDGATATREADRTRTWIRKANPLADEFHLDGLTNGVNREGFPYSTEILQTIVHKRECALSGVFIPVEGIKEITRGDKVWTVDFGDGTCDNTVTITFEGKIETTEVGPS